MVEMITLRTHVHTVILLLEQNNINSKQNTCHSDKVDRENIIQPFKFDIDIWSFSFQITVARPDF